MVLITAGLTALSLLVVRHSMQSHVREGIVQDCGTPSPPSRIFSTIAKSC
jgi:hypothetical protein